MIKEQENDSRYDVVNDPELTIEESFFIELLKKRDKQTIHVKYTQNGHKIGNLESFTNYYDENEILRLLDSLVVKKVITRQEKGIILLCPKCGSHANMPVLMCPRCGSTRISRKEDINHPDCEYWGTREEFIDGILLRCPRCHETLDETNIEGNPSYYSISDPYFECQSCGSAVSKNNLIMICIKCNKKYTTIEAIYLNSVSYILTEKPLTPNHTRKEPVSNKNETSNSFRKQKTQKTKKKKLETEKKTENKDNKQSIPSMNLKDTTKKPSSRNEKKPEKTRKKLMKSVKKVTEIFNKQPKESELETDSNTETIEKSNVSEDIELPRDSNPLQILLLIENITVSEFIIESIEELKQPINVLHVDDGQTALKELRKTYDVIIMDLDMTTIESKLILSEMEKWSIMTPIIALSDKPKLVEKYVLNVEAVLKKKQKDYKKIKFILNNSMDL